MAKLALTIVGQVIGNAILPGIGGAIGGAIGGFIGGALFDEPIEGGTVAGPKLNDLAVQSSTYGRPIPVVYGTFRLSGNVIWSPGLVEHVAETRSGGGGGAAKGGGGGGGGTILRRFFYTASFAVMLCEGPATVLQIFADGKLIVDFTADGVEAQIATALTTDMIEVGGGIRIYPGSETQLPDPAIQADIGVADTPAYRGRCYIMFEDLALDDYGNRIPQISAVVTTGTPTELFPRTEVDTNPLAFNWQQASLTPDKRFAHIFSATDPATVAVWDTITETMLFNTEIDLGNLNAGFISPFPVFDGQGFVYLSGRGTSFPDRQVVNGYKADTWELVFSSVPRDTETNFTGSMVITGRGGIDGPQYLHVGSSVVEDGWSVWSVVRGVAILVNDFKINDLVDIPGSPQATSLVMEVSQPTNQTVDGEGFVWGMWSDVATPSDTVYITQHDPATGRPLRIIEVPGSQFSSYMMYDPFTNSIVVQVGDVGMTRYDLDDDVWIGSLNSISTTFDNAFWWNGPLQGNGHFWTMGSTSFQEIDLETMSSIRVIQATSPNNWLSPNALRFGVYSPLTHVIITRSLLNPTLNQFHYLDRLQVGTGTTTLQAVVEDISSRVGLEAGDDIDATALTQIVYGYVLTTRMAARRGIEPLLPIYQFDAMESDHIVKYVNRGGASVVTLTQDDLGATADLAGAVPELVELRAQEPEMPERIDFLYADPGSDFQQFVQHAKRIREAVDTVGKVTFNAPIAFPATVAKQIVEAMLYTAWIERDSFTSAVNWSHIALDPTDIITINLDGVLFRVFITSTTWGADGVLEIDGLADDATSYESNAIGVEPSGVPDQKVTITGSSQFFVMDLPLLQDSDSGLIMYFAAGPFGSEAWPGASIFRALDFGAIDQVWAFAPKLTAVKSGLVGSILADTSNPWVWDRTNTLTVIISSTTLASDTEINVLNGSNGILIGNEIIQYATVVDNGNDTYTLSDLLRGRRGTEWATGTHVRNEAAVILTEETINIKAMSAVELNVEHFYKAATLGSRTLESGLSKAVTYMGRSSMPYSPVCIEGDNLGSPSDWVATWTRRTRIGGDWVDSVDALLSEATEDYQVDIIDETGSPEGVVRTITTSVSAGGSFVDLSPLAGGSVLYSEADQITDFGAPITTLTVRVYQMSEVVGRGVPGEAFLVGA